MPITPSKRKMEEENEVAEKVDIGGDSVEEMDTDSSDDEENDEKDLKVIKNLEIKISNNPNDYDSHLELIRCLKKAGELVDLRLAREGLSKAFPLTPELWLEWIQDEIKLCEDESEDKSKVFDLFERAVKDYTSVDLWLEYMQFSIMDFGKEGGLQRIREIAEKALIAVGLHVAQGALVFAAYRELENAVLAGFQPAPGAVASAPLLEQQQAQTKRIDKLFKRQLGIPLLDMETTWAEYEEWSEEKPDQHVTNAYEAALVKLKALEPFEQELLEAEGNKLEVFKSYLKFELKSNQDPARIQCLFERALLLNCLEADVWIRYGKYLDEVLRIRSCAVDMYQRAVRNCPWSSTLWQQYCRALERQGAQPHEKITGVFEKCVSSNQFGGAEDYLQIWTGYLDYMRRRVDFDNADHKEPLEELRKLFQRAMDFMNTEFGNEGDPNCTIPQYWARLEAKKCQNMEKARECWNGIMQRGFGNQAQMWLEYFNQERAFGDHKHCRKILGRALNSVTDWPEYIVDMYILFEREEGTLEQLDQALERCGAQMRRIEERKAAENEEFWKKTKGKGHQYVSPKKYCTLCKSSSHKTLAPGKCHRRRTIPLQNVTPFKGKGDVLSNFYPCKVEVFDQTFGSSEHAYQYMKALHCGNEVMADKIRQLDCPREVKILSKQLETAVNWEASKLDIMREIIQAKAVHVTEYKEALLSAKKFIVEAVPRDYFWSCGLSKEEVNWVDMANWPGENMMGKLHMELRDKLCHPNNNDSPKGSCEVYGTISLALRRTSSKSKRVPVLKKIQKRKLSKSQLALLTKHIAEQYSCYAIKVDHNMNMAEKENIDGLIESRDDEKIESRKTRKKKNKKDKKRRKHHHVDVTTESKRKEKKKDKKKDKKNSKRASLESNESINVSKQGSSSHCEKTKEDQLESLQGPQHKEPETVKSKEKSKSAKKSNIPKSGSMFPEMNYESDSKSEDDRGSMFSLIKKRLQSSDIDTTERTDPRSKCLKGSRSRDKNRSRSTSEKKSRSVSESDEQLKSPPKGVRKEKRKRKDHKTKVSTSSKITKKKDKGDDAFRSDSGDERKITAHRRARRSRSYSSEYCSTVTAKATKQDKENKTNESSTRKSGTFDATKKRPDHRSSPSGDSDSDQGRISRFDRKRSNSTKKSSRNSSSDSSLERSSDASRSRERKKGGRKSDTSERSLNTPQYRSGSRSLESGSRLIGSSSNENGSRSVESGERRKALIAKRIDDLYDNMNFSKLDTSLPSEMFGARDFNVWNTPTFSNAQRSSIPMSDKRHDRYNIRHFESPAGAPRGLKRSLMTSYDEPMKRRRSDAFFCQFCRTSEHIALAPNCKARAEERHTNITAFKGRDNVFSNFFPCRIRYKYIEFSSVEHAYQHTKCVINHRDELAKEVLHITDGPALKRYVKGMLLNKQWEESKEIIMYELIRVKAESCQAYSQALKMSRDVIVEAVPFDKHWSAGLAENDLMIAKREYWPGKNVMGNLHMRLRKELFRR